MSKIDLEFYGSCTLEQDGCTTCGDVAVPVRVLELTGSDAMVEDRVGQRAWVATNFTPNVAMGDILLVHLGIALRRLS